MSAYDNTSNESNSNSGAEEVRKAFAALTFEQKITTLIRVELDMLGDAVKTVVDAASKVADDIANAVAKPCPDTSEGPGARGVKA